jgi:hypothetical protein
MAQLTGGADWIGAFLEWTEGEFDGAGRPLAAPAMEAGDSRAEDTVAVYLEWLDAAPAFGQRAAAPDPLREAILLMALRTETECMHILRQVLEDGRTDARTLRLAMGELENVEADVLALSGRILELRAH